MLNLIYIIIGIASGILGGMGMGGGTILIPILTIFLKIDQPIAQAINLVSFIPMAIIVTIINIKKRKIDWKAWTLVVLPALITSVICAIWVKNINGNILRKCFGYFIIVLGVAMLSKTIYDIIKNNKKHKNQDKVQDNTEKLNKK